jgi:hypothetical protein
MKYAEDAVSEGVVNPLSRLIVLFFGTWLIASLHPIPETTFKIITRIYKNGDWSVILRREWFDFGFFPILGCLFSKTFLVSGPIALFCVFCSAMDRWEWRKVTLLSGLSNLTMCVLDTWPPRSTNLMILVIGQLVILSLFYLVIHLLLEREY